MRLTVFVIVFISLALLPLVYGPTYYYISVPNWLCIVSWDMLEVPWLSFLYLSIIRVPLLFLVAMCACMLLGIQGNSLHKSTYLNPSMLIAVICLAWVAMLLPCGFSLFLSVKVKVALLNYLHGLALLMDPSYFVNNSDTRLAVSRVITWTTEPKSVEVRKVCQPGYPDLKH